MRRRRGAGKVGQAETLLPADNRTVWVGTRGVGSVNVVDGLSGKLVGRVSTADGPSKVLFSPDGCEAYVNHIQAPVVTVVDVASRRAKYNITGLADKFSSDMMLSADGTSLWVAHKMTGQVSVINLLSRTVIAVLDTGAETNHPNFAYINGTNHAFVTVASLNHTKVYSQPTASDQPQLVAVVQASGIEPRGLWPSPDNSRMYVLNEHSDTMDIIETASLNIVDTVAVGQEGQALVYVAGAAPDRVSGESNLGSQGLGMKAMNKFTSVQVKAPVAGSNATAQALVTVRQAAGVDMFQVVGRNLKLNGSHTASAACTICGEDSVRIPLVSFNASTPTNMGCGSAPQVLAFFKFFGVYDPDSVEVAEDA